MTRVGVADLLQWHGGQCYEVESNGNNGVEVNELNERGGADKKMS